MKRSIHILLISVISASALFITSCSTDFELNADYDEVPVIFGILDQSVDTQFVKINKSFIGDGNNMDYASVNDSSLYTDVVARVEEYVDDVIDRTFTLEEMWVSNLDDGIFYTDSQKVYFFVPSAPLNENATYKLIVDVSEEGEPIVAETNLIIGSDLTWTLITSNAAAINGYRFADASTLSEDDYLSMLVEFYPAYNADRYELKMRFHFTEWTASGSTEKYLDWNLGEIAPINGNYKKEIDGKAFFAAIDSKLSNYAYEAEVIKRVITNNNVELIVTAANEDLSLFIGINQPSTGVVTEQPIFTNIEGGVGMFASRFSNNLFSFLDTHTSNVLCNGPETSQYKFCIDPVWDGTPTNNGQNMETTYPGIRCL